MEKKTVYLTQEGYEELKKELDDLINVKRPLNIKAIKEARALGGGRNRAKDARLPRLVGGQGAHVMAQVAVLAS